MTEFVDFSQEVTQKRRDLRSGGQIARTQPLPNGMYVEMTWGEPLPGRLTETYRTEKDTLYVESTIDVAGGKEESLVVRSCCSTLALPREYALAEWQIS